MNLSQTHKQPVQQAMTTEDFLRQEVFGKATAPAEYPVPEGAMSTEDFLKHVVFRSGTAEEQADLARKAAVQKGYTQQGMQQGQNAAHLSGNALGVAHNTDNPVFLQGTTQKVEANSGAVRALLELSADGRIQNKQEQIGKTSALYTYEYDDRGHLRSVRTNGGLTEAYTYNAQGQRITDHVAWRGAKRTLAYNMDGTLASAGATQFFYDKNGALAGKQEYGESTFYSYGDDTRLDSVVLPDGLRIAYTYNNNSLGPVAKKVNGRVAESYHWLDSIRLGVMQDHISKLSYTFHYSEGRLPHSVTIVPMQAPSLFENPTTLYTYTLGYDQVGSLKAVSDPNGNLIKELTYDSFGNITSDSNPALFIPIGFAGGLSDKHTGFVHFGHRDYDPTIGRFTAIDPMGDTGGDHDLWDYCVDDPINAYDPLGLFIVTLGVLGGMALATTLGGVGTWLAAKAADKLGKTGTKVTDASMDAMKTVSKINATIAGTVAAGELAYAYGPQVLNAGKNLVQGGTRLVNKGIDIADDAIAKGAYKIMGKAPNNIAAAESITTTADVVEAAAIPGPPSGSTIASAIPPPL